MFAESGVIALGRAVGIDEAAVGNWACVVVGSQAGVGSTTIVVGSHVSDFVTVAVASMLVTALAVLMPYDEVGDGGSCVTVLGMVV